MRVQGLELKASALGFLDYGLMGSIRALGIGLFCGAEGSGITGVGMKVSSEGFSKQDICTC